MPNKFLPPQTDTATRTASTPIQGEILYDTDEDQLYYGDGATTGGVVVGSAGAFADLSDVDTTGLQTGQAMVWNGAVWVPGSTGRDALTADRTYYVRTDGSDSNDGLSDSAGGAFLTIQKAVDVTAMLDVSIYDVTIQVGNGTYTVTSSIELKPPLGSGTVFIQGDTTTPSNVVITSSSANLFTQEGSNQVLFHLRGVKMTTTGTGVNCIRLLKNASFIYSLCDFGSCTGQHINCLDAALCFCDGDYTISGGASTHWGAYSGSSIRCQSKTITITGTPSFSGSFIAGGTAAQFIINSNTFSGTATGVKYSLSGNCVAQVSGGDLPGNTGGSVTTGAQYF